MVSIFGSGFGLGLFLPQYLMPPLQSTTAMHHDQPIGFPDNTMNLFPAFAMLRCSMDLPGFILLMERPDQNVVLSQCNQLLHCHLKTDFEKCLLSLFFNGTNLDSRWRKKYFRVEKMKIHQNILVSSVKKFLD